MEHVDVDMLSEDQRHCYEFIHELDEILDNSPGFADHVTANGFNLAVIERHLEVFETMVKRITSFIEHHAVDRQPWEPIVWGLLEKANGLVEKERLTLEAAREAQAVWERIQGHFDGGFLDVVNGVGAAYNGEDSDEDMEVDEELEQRRRAPGN